MKEFPNGFESWHETHFEMVQYIVLAMGNTPDYRDFDSQVYDTSDSQGGAGLYELAREWTDEFELKNKGRDWSEEGDFYEETEAFARSKDFGTDFNDELLVLYSKVTTVTESKEIIYPAIGGDGEEIEVTSSQLNLLKLQKLVWIHNLEYVYYSESLEKIKNIIYSK